MCQNVHQPKNGSTVVCHKRIAHSNENERTVTICNRDETYTYNVEGKNTNSKEYILYTVFRHVQCSPMYNYGPNFQEKRSFNFLFIYI